MTSRSVYSFAEPSSTVVSCLNFGVLGGYTVWLWPSSTATCSHRTASCMAPRASSCLLISSRLLVQCCISWLRATTRDSSSSSDCTGKCRPRWKQLEILTCCHFDGRVFKHGQHNMIAMDSCDMFNFSFGILRRGKVKIEMCDTTVVFLILHSDKKKKKRIIYACETSAKSASFSVIRIKMF